jgi:hypothetical protein
MTYTVIRLAVKTKERLRKYGKFGESYDDLINRILEEIEKSNLKNKLERR